MDAVKRRRSVAVLAAPVSLEVKHTSSFNCSHRSQAAQGGILACYERGEGAKNRLGPSEVGYVLRPRFGSRLLARLRTYAADSLNVRLVCVCVWQVLLQAFLRRP